MTTHEVRKRPILFSGPMVRAILADRKTVTRRLVNPQPPAVDDVRSLSGSSYDWMSPESRIDHWRVAGPVWAVRQLMGCEPLLKCPHGKVGDRLWVRETFARSRNNWLYAADSVVSEGPQGNTDDWDWDDSIPNKWRPSVFMPREACRLILEITNARVERLHEITEQDAIAEGFSGSYSPAYVSGGEVVGPDGQTPIEEFAETWDKLNAKRGHSWGSNPWVWVIEFKAVKP